MIELVFLRSKAYAFKYSRMTETAPAVASCQAVSTGVDSVIRPAAKASRIAPAVASCQAAAKASTEDEVKKMKGITKSTIEHDITFQNFKDAITEPYENVFYKKMYVLNSEKHEMFVKEMNKKAISPFDDKRWIDNNGIDTYPHGYDNKFINNIK